MAQDIFSTYFYKSLLIGNNMAKSTKIASLYNNVVVDIAMDTMGMRKQALVFVNTKKSAEVEAERIAKKRKLEKNSTEEYQLKILSEEILKVLSSPTKQCKRLAACVAKGTAFHHAGLAAKQRELVEGNFKKGVIRIICATPTLAAGINLPAFRVVIRDLSRFEPRRGMARIPVLEYHQMAGRAGRPDFNDEYGEAICIAQTESQKEGIIKKYIHGEPEEIYSKLAVEPVLRTYLLSLIASNFVNTIEEIMDFFGRTFYAHTFGNTGELESIIRRMLNLLASWDFIGLGNIENDFTSADELENDSSMIKATPLGKRVAQLYLDPLTAHELIKGIERSKELIIMPFTLLHLVCSALEMRPLLRAKTAEYETIQEKINLYNERMLQKEPPLYESEYEDFLNAIKTTMLLDEWIDERNEDYLLETYSATPGELKYKIDIADWLLYSCVELAKLLPHVKFVAECNKLRSRLKYGAREELLPLLKLKNIGRIRARKLFANRIKDVGDVRKADFIVLTQLIGRATAIDIKKQVGEDISKLKVKKNKRKGQISLNDYK